MDLDEKLIEAAKEGNLFEVKYLIRKGANIHAKTLAFSDLALRSAARNGHVKIVKYLIKKDANIHSNDNDTLLWAARNGHVRVVKYLLEECNPPANIHVCDHVEVVKYSLQIC